MREKKIGHHSRKFGQLKRAWERPSFGAPRNLQLLSTSTFLLCKFWKQGKPSLHALQANIRILEKIFIFQITFYTRMRVWEEKLSPRDSDMHIWMSQYALFTLNFLFFYSLQIHLFIWGSRLREILSIEATTIELKRYRMEWTFQL